MFTYVVVPLAMMAALALGLVAALAYDRTRIQTRWARGKLYHRADLVCDSVSPAGVRLSTFLLWLPKWLLAELNTHGTLAKSASSSRSIPTSRYIRQVLTNPVCPIEYGRNGTGMQSSGGLTGWRRPVAEHLWLLGRYPAVALAYLMSQVPLHKQVANRVLEPWVWAEVVVTGDADMLRHFFWLRDHAEAQPELREVAFHMHAQFDHHQPRRLNDGEWHLPFITQRDRWSGMTIYELIMVSVARCARASYGRAGGKLSPFRDFGLYNRLRSGTDRPHAGPFEHVCRPAADPAHRSGRFVGWHQYRKLIEAGLEGLDATELTPGYFGDLVRERLGLTGLAVPELLDESVA
jgi:hypothetical protein